MIKLLAASALSWQPPSLSANGPRRAAPICSATFDHEHWMLYALRLAEQARLATPPNPWVGCVIVAEGGTEVLAEGYHVRKGDKHAEATALADARSRGVSREAMAAATCYVTLEPCHRGPGKSTPPCDEAMVASGLRDVHVAVIDPDPAFGGAGIGHLRSHGVRVTVGTASQAVAASLRPYLHQRRTRLPYVVLKVAAAADGAIACADGTSQWITGSPARAHAQLLRAESQAILVGSGTALADKPRLTLRLDDDALPSRYVHTPHTQPLRVLLDARGRVDSGPLLDASLAPTLVFTTRRSRGSAARAAWEAAAGLEVCEVPSCEGEDEGGGGSEGNDRDGSARAGDGAAADDVAADDAAADDAAGDRGGVDLRAVLHELGARGVIQLMVEGGGGVHGAFMMQRLAQQLRLYVGATALGSTATRWVRAPLAPTIAVAPRWRLLTMERVGEDACLDYDLSEGETTSGVGGEANKSVD